MLNARRIFLSFLSFLILILIASSAYSAVPGVVSFTPSGTVQDNISFRVVFKNQVVKKNDAGKTIAPDNILFPFTVSPALQLEGKWLNDRKTFTAKLLAPLKSATQYTATLRNNLKDVKGNKIGPGKFNFQTEGLKATDIRASIHNDGRAYFDLNFNSKVDPARLKGFLEIFNNSGQKVAYNINGSLPGKIIRISLPVERLATRQNFTVKINSGFKSSEGDLGFTQDFKQNVVLDPVLIPGDIFTEENALRVYFNFGIDPQTAKSFINVEPKVDDLKIESGYSDELIYLRSEKFTPRNRFVITFKKGFPSKSGVSLREDFKQAVIMPDLESEVKLTASGIYLTPIDDGLIPIELLNAKKLQLDLWQLYENNIPVAVKAGEYFYFDKDLSRRIFTSEIDLNLPLNTRVKKNIPVDEMTKGKRGLFLLTARDTDQPEWYEARQIISLSDIGATVKLWEDSALIWANSLTELNPIDNAKVKIFSNKNQLIAQGETDNDGICILKPQNETWEKENLPSVAIISKNSDLTYIQLTKNLLDREIFDTAGRNWIKSGYDAEIISPRDIYRTGEEANFKAIVRNFDLTTPEIFPVLFIVKDPLNRKVKQEAVELNSNGSALFNLNLPSNALTGNWNISLAIPGNENEPIAVHNFHVEDFAPPRIEVNLNSQNKFLSPESNFTVDINSNWLFGAPGAGLKYTASWIAKALDFVPNNSKWKAYKFGDESRNFPPLEGYITENFLDNSGHAVTNLALNSDWDAPSLINVTIKAEVTEDTGRTVTNFISRKYYPSDHLIGIAPENDKLTVRNNLKFSVIALDQNENLIDPGELTAKLMRVTWNYNLVEIDGNKRWQSTEEFSEIEQKNLNLKDGKGSITFKPEQYGTYIIQIADENDIARTAYRFYAEDPSYTGSGSQLLDRVEITCDKEFYNVGDVAKIKINAPFEGLMLMTVEGADLISRTIQKINNSETVIEIPINKNFEPNAWVNVWLIRAVNNDDAKNWGAHRAIGAAKIKTNLENYKINIALDAPEKFEPAKNLPVKISTNAKNADIAIALVDDGVLNLTRYKVPDLLNHFWGIKKLNSEGYDIYDQLIPVEDRTADKLHPAGDMALAALAGDSNVQRFKILSIFQNFTTDNNGNLETEIELPEFSGRGKLFIVAASGKNFGSASQNIQIARDIVTETGLPRFATPGDEFIIPVSIFNNSNNDHDVNIKLIPEGMNIDNLNYSVNIPAGGKAINNFNAKVFAGINKAKLNIITSWPEKEFTQEIEMPVRSAWSSVTTGGSGIFTDGETKINIPLKDFAGDVTGSFILADAPSVNLTQAAGFLLNYPYGCLEQTISSAWPFLILPDAISEIDPELINSEQVKLKTQDAITKIQAMQLYNGSFSMYPGTGRTYEWGSVYAAHFLISAKNSGINFPDEMLNGALNYLRQLLASMPEYKNPGDMEDDFTTKAYAVYVLSLNGEKPSGWIEYLRENLNIMWNSGLIYLAGAQSIIDGRADALRDLKLNSKNYNGYNTLESDARNLAALLNIWLDVEPGANEVHELAKRISESGKNNGWHSTQDNSAVLMALARYNSEVTGIKNTLAAKLLKSTSDTPIANYWYKKPAAINLNNIKDENLIIEAEGEGNAYYSWYITGIPAQQPKAERKNLNIDCTYYDEKGNVININNPIKRGTILRAVLNIKPALTVTNLAVNYLIPAGLEIDNPRITDGENLNYNVVSDIKDDRITLFFDKLNHETSYGIKLRAVTAGKFMIPQISAFGMYDPLVRFTGKAQNNLIINK